MTPYAPYPLNLVRDWFHRRRWWVRLALAVVLVPWFGHFAYTRWTGKPGKPLDLYGTDPTDWDAVLPVPDPALDRTTEMVAAIQSLPPLPTVQVPTTAPAGMTWMPASDRAESLSSQVSAPGPSLGAPGAVAPPTPSFTVEPDCALCGEWKPQDRHHLQQIVDYLEQPATSAALEKIRSLAGQPYCLSHSSSGMGGPAGAGFLSFRQTVEILTARARYRLAHQQDFRTALQDIETVVQLAEDAVRQPLSASMPGGLWMRRLAMSEIGSWAQEFDLSAEHCRLIAEMIQRHRMDVAALASASLEAEVQLARSGLDMFYTKDARKNGWLVLHRREPGVDWLACENLFSLFFDDRRETLGRLEQIERHARSTMAAQIDRRFETDPSAERGSIRRAPTAPCLGPMARSLFDFCLAASLHYVNATGAAVITIHALEAYRRRHGAYPVELSALVPEMLDTLPLDPCSRSQAPLRYRPESTEAQGYVLYSVGVDGRDEGDVSTSSNSGDANWLFAAQRRDLDETMEWILAPAGSQKPPGFRRARR